jgi:hypothetical protein
MQKAYWTRTKSRGQPSRATKVTNLKRTLSSWMFVQTFPSCSGKKGLFGRAVPKSREAWQTMELYRARISEVHQTHVHNGKSIWAHRECLGHSISKKKWAKIWCFEWVILGITFSLRVKSWTSNSWLPFVNVNVDWLHKWTQPATNWNELQIGLIGYTS